MKVTEKYIGEAPLKRSPKKKLSLVIKNKAIDMSKLSNDVVDYIDESSGEWQGSNTKVKLNDTVSYQEAKQASTANPGTIYFSRGTEPEEYHIFLNGEDFTGLVTLTAGNNPGTLIINGDTEHPITIIETSHFTDMDVSNGWLRKFIDGNPTQVIKLVASYNDLTDKLTKSDVETLLQAPNGVAILDNTGKIPSSQLPSYVDDIIDFIGCYEYQGSLYRPLTGTKLKPNPDPSTDFNNNTVVTPGSTLEGKLYIALKYDTPSDTGLYRCILDDTTWAWDGPTQGETGKIYVEESTSKSYRFPSGSTLYEAVEVVASPGTLDDIVDGSTNKHFTATEKTKLGGVASEATKTEASQTNGNIKINSTETNVYTHPDAPASAGTGGTAPAAKKIGMDAKGHVVLGDNLAKSDVGLGDVTNNKQIKAVSNSDMVEGHFVVFGIDGSTVEDAGFGDDVLERNTNKVTSIDNTSTDTQYPSAKCVYYTMASLGIVYDVSAYNNNATFASLQALLSSANIDTLIPTSVRKGGMSIKFVQSSDNNYVQARCMAQNFTTDVTQWQGVDDEPTENSHNLVESGGVFGELEQLASDIEILDDDINGSQKIEVTEEVTGIGSYGLVNFTSPIPKGSVITSITPMDKNAYLAKSQFDYLDTLTNALTYPYTTTEEYVGLKIFGNGDVFTVTYNNGKENKTGLIADVEELSDDLNELSLYVKGVKPTEKTETVACEGNLYASEALLSNPLPIGTIIKSISWTNDAIVWLTNSNGGAAINLSTITTPYTTLQVLRGFKANTATTITIKYEYGETIPGLEDRVREIVFIKTTDTESEIFAKFLSAFKRGFTDVIFEKGVYTLKNVYQEISETLSNTWTMGLPVGNDCRYFGNGSTIKSNKPDYAWTYPRNIFDSQAQGSNFEIYDFILMNYGGTYCVHDEGNKSNTPYLHSYKNVKMIYYVTEDVHDNGPKAFGCGLGYDTTLVFDCCQFIRANNETLQGLPFAIHGVLNATKAQKFVMSMTNSYIKGSTIDVNSIDKVTDTIEYYLANNLWGVPFTDSNYTECTKYNNVVES